MSRFPADFDGRIGEGWGGEPGPNGCHVNVVLGERGSPTAAALIGTFTTPAPGHTPGHHSLLVKLKEMGNVLITGDLSHFHENYDGGGVPTFNTDRAATIASLDRFKKLAANLKATVIIQHDGRDVSRLPAFPAAAR